MAVISCILFGTGTTSLAGNDAKLQPSNLMLMAPAPVQIVLTAPNRMVNTKTLTLMGSILTTDGSVDWQTCNQLGTVSATRVSNGSAVPLTVTVFERHTAGAGAGGPPTTDSIRLYNGVGCVSFTLNNGAGVPAGDILVTVTVGGVTASKLVTVLDAATPGLFQNLSGTLSGGNLTWEPADGVIRLTGNVTVPSGQTLTILPGTLIMVDAGADGNGTKISSGNSTISAQGTQTAPIYFFPTTGAAAMALPQTGGEGSANGHNNPSAWGGFDLTGSGVMTWSYVFMTGAGNGVISGHPRPTVIRLAETHAFTAANSVMADSPGKIIYAIGNGVYTFQRCLFARNGIGGEYIGTGYTLTMEDTWMTRIGRAPINAANRLDGDIIHIDQPSNSHLRRCILTDGGDDVIDHSGGATPVVQDSIIYDANDKVVSIGGGATASITMTNCLVFNVPNGITCAGAPAFLTNCTLGSSTNVNGRACTSAIQKCILWTNSTSTCCGTVNFTIVGNSGNLGCGTGNLSVNPQFVNTTCDYGLQPTSPALSAGPAGTQIGWLGFPSTRRVALMSGTLSAPATVPNSTVDYTIFVQDAQDLGRYQTFLSITRTSGSGSLIVDCPGGVHIDEQRSDYAFFGLGSTSVITDCLAGSATSSLSSGFVNIGSAPRYLSTYNLRVSSDATQGAMFEIRALGISGSSLADPNNLPIPFAIGPASVLTIGLCPAVDAGINLAVCAGGTATLNGAQSHASGTTWSATGDGSFGNPSLLGTTYTPGPNDIASGSVTLTLTGGPIAPCQIPSSDSLVLTIQHAPTANAGGNQALCNGSSADLTGATQFSTGCIWTTAGDGSFDNAGLLSAIYTPGATDIATGQVVLSLSCSGVSPCVAPSTGTVTITWTPGALDGDMNGNGQTNGADIRLFIMAVMSQSHAAADVCQGDFTLDGVVSIGDLPGMVNRLIGD
ncbi:hypothetical protein B7486_12515 [cyanobacterium TDX16]|nr:hypothetical protein B7486_12515 [cyanobacterium TDX16]